MSASRPARRWIARSSAILAVVSLPVTASAQDAATRTGPTDRAPLGLGVQGGVRVNGLTHAGAEPFSRAPVLVQGSLGVGGVVLRRQRLTLVAGPTWDLGQTDATTRGDATSLTLHRLTVSLEARYTLWPWLRPYVRVAPGALHVRANVNDPVLDAPFAVRTWTWTVDVAAGVAIPLGQPASWRSFPYRFGLQVEGGYGFSGLVAMKLTPRNDDASTRSFEAIRLPDFRPAGALLRVAATLAF